MRALEIRGRRLLNESGIVPWLCRALLTPFSLLYGSVVKVRNWMYASGMKKSHKSPLLVVSVGNLVMGGTGKTPLVRALAEELSKTKRVAILSRGYGGKVKYPHLVKPNDSAREVGDEPLLLAQSLPSTQVIVGRKRHLSARLARELGAEILLLDDGMQHRQLARDVEIVLLDGEEKKPFFPKGFVRDDPKRIGEADTIFYNGEHPPSEEYIHIAFREKEAFFEDKRVALKGLKAALFCGIGAPERFVEGVKKSGVEVVETLFLGDHERISEKELTSFAGLAKKRGASALLCTLKDWVKLENRKTVLPIGWVERELVIKKNQEKWDALLRRIYEAVA